MNTDSPDPLISSLTRVELVTTSVGTRTKWKSGKKLSRRVYVGRLIFKDPRGKRSERSREFQRKSDAEDFVRLERLKFEASGSRPKVGQLKFDDLADYYERYYATSAQYVGEKKVSGLRSLGPVLGNLKVLRSHFGIRKLEQITYGEIRAFKLERVATPVRRKRKRRIPLTAAERKNLGGRKRTRDEYYVTETPRTVASVHRELMTLRRMLNVAVTEGWLSRNPINAGPSLINMADEEMRTRILSREEESRLLAVCNVPERLHLRSLIVCLLDTGFRLNEALTLTWDDVDLANGVITVRASNTKTARAKSVPISTRLFKELERLREQQHLWPSGCEENSRRVFGITNGVSHSWRTARRLARLEDVRLHDLRHTFGTRLDRSGFTQAQIARILGHQQVHTTYRYTNPDSELHDLVRAAIDGS